jgi:hypothetical protein
MKLVLRAHSIPLPAGEGMLLLENLRDYQNDQSRLPSAC